MLRDSAPICYIYYISSKAWRLSLSAKAMAGIVNRRPSAPAFSVVLNHGVHWDSVSRSTPAFFVPLACRTPVAAFYTIASWVVCYEMYTTLIIFAPRSQYLSTTLVFILFTLKIVQFTESATGWWIQVLDYSVIGIALFIKGLLSDVDCLAWARCRMQIVVQPSVVGWLEMDP